MASISDDPNGRKRILFIGADGKRRAIRLGKISARQAEAVKVRIEKLIAGQISAHPPDAETSQWLQQIDGGLREKLEGVGLVESRGTASATLAGMLAEFVAAAEVKPNTLLTYRQTEGSLLKFFGGETRIRDIGPLGAEKWRQDMKAKGLAVATISKRIKTARQMFRRAVKWKMITENPFTDVVGGSQTNKSRQFFLTRNDAQLVLQHCPDAQWRAIFALSRFGGLRCPSEHLLLTWSDIDWEGGRIKVTSPKTERYPGGDMRIIPLFPELRTVLMECFEQAEEGDTFVITRYRQKNCNLRTQLRRILKRAVLKQWPKLFHNLRATRQTELEESFPSHVVCAWMGNSEKVAQKHYLQMTDAHFEKAAQNQAQQDAADVGTHRKTQPVKTQNPPVLPRGSVSCEQVPVAPVTLTGSELHDDSAQKTHGDPKGGAQCGAVPADEVSDLARRLASLSDEDRERILRAIERSTSEPQ